MTSDLSPELLQKINYARSIDGSPTEDLLVPYRNIGELLSRQAEDHEGDPFLIYYGDETPRREYAYGEFHEEVCRTANLLRATGVGRGDRVAVISPNHADVVILYMAAFLLGAVVVPISAGEDDKRIRYVLENSGARLAFVRDHDVERIASLRPAGVETILQAGQRVRSSFPHFTTELPRHSSRFIPQDPPGPDDDALIIYTSGTTGHPKGVVLSQNNLLSDAMGIAEWHHLSDDQRMMCVLPLHHVNGIVVTLLTPLYAGGSVVLNQKFHSARFFERIGAERVSIVSVVPTLLQFLLHSRLDMEAYRLANLRHVICGAGPLTVDLAAKFEQTFKIPIMHGYGLSETTCYSCFLPVDLTPAEHRHWLSKYGFPSIGVPMPINEMAIHDEKGNELDEGQRGEIVIRGHNVMKYYFREPDVNAVTFAHGWFRSGDEGFFRFDDQGRRFFFITGRIKELIIRGGANISPFEIDEVLMNIPGVAAGIAVGFENEWYGEEVGAYVKPMDGMDLKPEDILAYCRKVLPFAKSPKVVLLGADVPVTSTGKYQRSKLRDLFAAWKAVQFTEPR